MQTTDQLHAEIRSRLGVLPSFFQLASEDPKIAASLWAFAKFGYLDNPLPALFKERLFVSLSRLCEVRYCIARHVGFLIGLGNPAGDPEATPETVEEVVALLRRPLSQGGELERLLEVIQARREPTEQPPEPGSDLEAAVLDCAAHVFADTVQAAPCKEALEQYFEPRTLQYLLVLLAFVRTAHYWTVLHPELDLESDLTEMLKIHEALASCVVSQPEPLSETLQALLEERETLRQERSLREQLERANAELREERERLQTTLASIADAVVTTDGAGRVLSMNPAAVEMLAVSREEGLGRPLHEVLRILDERTREVRDDPVARALQGAELQESALACLIVARGGVELPVELTVAPIVTDDQAAVGCVLTFRDVTARRREHESAQRLAAIVESSSDAIVSKSLQGVIRTWNAGAEQLFGYTAEQAIGCSITMLIPPDRIGEEEMIISRIMAGERLQHFDTVRVRQDGSPVEVSVSISPVKDIDGKVVGASKVARDITERRRAEEAMRKVAEATAQADERKDRFLAILAHELRNPLSPLRACIEVLRSDPACQGSEPLAIMDRQVTQMVRLIDDLLDISRISRGKLRLRKAPTELQQVIQAAIESVQPRIAKKDLAVDVQGASSLIRLHADRARLTQVFTNLLTNAEKVSPPGGTITIAVTSADERLSVSVTDEGRGISGGELETIFEMFNQGDDLTQGGQGLGIGLTMARELVAMHGGQLTASSQGLGRGATFTVTLPLVAGDLAALAEPAPAGLSRSSSWAGLKVLVVDDTRDAADSLGMLLSRRGCEVRTEYRGEAALKTAQEFRPALAFLDLGMPGMGGVEVAERLRREDWGRSMLLVALSGWGQPADRAKTRQAGFDEHLLKPADMAALEGLLTRAKGTELPPPF